MSNGETAGGDEEAPLPVDGDQHSPPESAREPSEETREPEPPDRDWDAEWRSLTSDLAPPRPRYLVSDTPSVGANQGPRDYSAPEAPDEDPDDDLYVPELPPRQPRDRLTSLAWAAIAAGPALLLLAVIAFDRAPSWYVATCLGLFVGGCVVAFTRLPGSRRDDGGDGSAV